MTDWITLSVAGAALAISLITWLRTHTSHKYEVADQLLSEIVKISLEYPLFRSDEYCKEAVTHSDDETRLRYDAYATLVWNYLETLYHTYGKSLNKSPFYGAMRDLGRRHKDWFFAEDRHLDYDVQLSTFLKVKR